MGTRVAPICGQRKKTRVGRVCSERCKLRDRPGPHQTSAELRTSDRTDQRILRRPAAGRDPRQSSRFPFSLRARRAKSIGVQRSFRGISGEFSVGMRGKSINAEAQCASVQKQQEATSVWQVCYFALSSGSRPGPSSIALRLPASSWREVTFQIS
jgi:hypothetical protein